MEVAIRVSMLEGTLLLATAHVNILYARVPSPLDIEVTNRICSGPTIAFLSRQSGICFTSSNRDWPYRDTPKVMDEVQKQVLPPAICEN